MKTPVLESLINNVAGLQPCNFIKETPTQVFSCEYCKSSRSSFLYRALVIAAFAKRFQTTSFIISTYANLLPHFIFARFLLIERKLWKVCTTKGDSHWLHF